MGWHWEPLAPNYTGYPSLCNRVMGINLLSKFHNVEYIFHKGKILYLFIQGQFSIDGAPIGSTGAPPRGATTPLFHWIPLPI